MTNKLVLAFPDQLVLTYPDLASFTITYLAFGIVFYTFRELTGESSDREWHLFYRIITPIMYPFLWPFVIMHTIKFMERKLVEENLYEETIDELAGE